MTDFDREKFEALMGNAVNMHIGHYYEDALAASTEAYEMAPDNTFEKGRAARDNGARCDRLGRTKEAEKWAKEAYAIHDGLVNSMVRPSREALRERSVSAMYVGVNGLRNVLGYGIPLDYQTTEPSPVDYMRQTWSDIGEAKAMAPTVIDQLVDQYEVNAVRRVSIAESLMGNRRRGLSLGIRAVGLAIMSESPRLDTSNPNMDGKLRTKAKYKALLGGVAALGVNLLAAKESTTRRKLALMIADKTI